MTNGKRETENAACRRSGFDGWVPSYALRDLDEMPRIADGRVDMGAYEIPADDPPPDPVRGALVAAIKDDGNIADGPDAALSASSSSTRPGGRSTSS